MKVLIDTNIWISVFINKDIQSFIKKLLEKDIQIISSIQQIEEISIVLNKPRLAEYINKNLVEEFSTLFLRAIEVVEIKVQINECRDEKDNFILEAGISGEANFIITEDKDLLVLNPFRNLEIVTIKKFINDYLNLIG